MREKEGGMIKILVVGVSDKVGGIETFFYGLFKEKNEDCDVSFLTFSKKCAFEDEYVRNGYTIYHLPTRRSLPLTFSKIIKDFYKKYNDFDFIWVNTASTSMYELQYYGKRITNAQIITHSHGIAIEKTSGNFLYVINNLLSKINYYKVIKSTDLFFCCSKMAGIALFGEKYQERLTIINNGIETEKYKYNLGYRNEIRESLNISADTLVLAVIGRLSGVKNPIKSIDVFKELHSKHPDSLMLLVGDGELMGSVQERVAFHGLEANVKILGLRNDVNKILSAVDILLMPSLFEGLPLSAIEAQASGVKGVLSDTITEEVAITDLIHFLSLKESNTIWADYILKNCIDIRDRDVYAEAVRRAGYDKASTLSKVVQMLECEKNSRG